jgi:hypothetical protein
MKKILTLVLMLCIPALLSAQAPPNADAGSDTTVCSGDTILLSGTATGGVPPYTYEWNPGGFTTSSVLVSPAQNTTYTLTVFDSNGKKGTDQVTVYTNIRLNVKTTDAICFGGSEGTATVTPAGGTAPYTYLWSPGGATSDIITGIKAGTYTVTVWDNGSCIQTSTVTIKEPPDIVITVNETPSTCSSNGSACITVTGGTPGYSYNWANGSVTACISNLAPGTYSVTVTDKNGCIKKGRAIISDPGSPVLNTTSSNVSCFGGNDGSATAATTGGVSPYTYQWSPYGGNGTIASALSAGAYTVTVTDKSGCLKTATVIITQPTQMSITPSSSDATCGSSDGSVSVNVTGSSPPYDYLWSPGGATTSSVNNLSAGTYTVTVTNKNNCTQTAVATVSDKGAPSVSVSSSNVSCPYADDGSATASTTGGSTPYTYSWNTTPPQNSASATGLSSGTWVVTVTGSNGCKTVRSVTITSPQPAATTFTTQNTTCSTCCNGSATASSSGGTSPYTYIWKTSPIQTGPVATGLCSNVIYTVTVNDKNGCTYTATVKIYSSPTGIKAPEKAGINVFPNPFIEKIFISPGDGNQNMTTVSVFNSAAQKVWEFSCIGNTLLPVDTQKLPPGIYFIEILDGDRVIGRKKTVKTGW